MDEQEQTRAGSKDSAKTNDVFQRSLSAGYWFLIDTLVQRVLVFGTFFITARLLVPADYGIIALAMIYPSLLDGLTAIAFEQRENPIFRKDGDQVCA
jgi:hypothetical protein